MTNLTDSAQSKQIDQVEHNNDASAKRIVVRAQDPESGGFVNIGAIDNGDGTYSLRDGSSTPLAVRIDDTTTADTTYIGKAAIGSATSASVWQIMKLDTSSGIIKTWADGSSSFTQEWDERVNLSYS